MKSFKQFSGGMAMFMALLLVIALSGTPALGQPKYTLKFNHVLSPREPYHAGFLKWAKAVEERTKGGLKIEVFPSAQLGVEEDILEQIRAGANVGQNTDSARMGMYVPGIAVMNGPYFVETLGGVGEGPLGSDAPFPGAAVIPEEIARLRYSLTPEEQERYRWLGERVSLALEKTMIETKQGEKESEVVGRLCQELWRDRIDPITLMSAADERISKFRHPIPTEKRVEKILMVSVNARKWGLIVSLTRFIHFGKISDELKEKYHANVFIDCAMMAHTRPGLPAREVLQKGIDAYREKGYPGEWKLHHQGGSIGYTGRDYRTHFKTPDIIQENQAFTWNPSLTGTKSEDTILATSRGPVMITFPILFPTLSLEVAGISFKRPEIFEKT